MEKKKDYTEQDVMEFIEGGWNFRTKAVGGKRYITRRKGQVERSLGPYKEELWNLIQNVEKRVRGKIKAKRAPAKTGIPLINFESEFEPLDPTIFERQEEFLQFLSQFRGSLMQQNCKHRKGNFCEYWKYPDNPFFSVLDSIYEIPGMYRKVKDNKTGDVHWILQANAHFCANCSAYSL